MDRLHATIDADYRVPTRHDDSVRRIQCQVVQHVATRERSIVPFCRSAILAGSSAVRLADHLQGLTIERRAMDRALDLRIRTSFHGQVTVMVWRVRTQTDQRLYAKKRNDTSGR